MRAVLPVSVNDGESLTVEVRGAFDLAGRAVTIQLQMVTLLESAGFVASIGGQEVGADGTVVGVWANVSVGREGATFASSIQVDGAEIGIEDSSVCILNPRYPIEDRTAADERLQELHRQQRARYAIPLGDPTAPDANEHFVVCAIERLLTTTKMKLPGIHIFPVSRRSIEAEQRDVVNHILGGLGRIGRVEDDHWMKVMGPGRPWTAVVFPQVWALTVEEAGVIAREARDELITLLGLNRTARGTPVATIVEEVNRGAPPALSLSLDDARYRGNLLGGRISGENQTVLVAQHHAIHADPLLHLCVDLYSEAVAERSLDAQYFRYWSVLETLSGARMPAGQLVRLSNGSPWPGSRNTTSAAAPRVYRYVSDWLLRSNVSEAIQVSPAPDVYTAVRAWYGRRNATGHYGRFVATDPTQMTQGWFKWANRTTGDPSAWLRGLRDTCHTVLSGELMKIGAPAIE